MSMLVRVDDREAGSEVAASLREMEDVQVEIVRLAVGDYVWEDRLLFERETLVDLVASIKDGRLFRQASELAASPLPAAISLPAGCGGKPSRARSSA